MAEESVGANFLENMKKLQKRDLKKWEELKAEGKHEEALEINYTIKRREARIERIEARLNV